MKWTSRPIARRYSRALLDLTKHPTRAKGEAMPSPDALLAELGASVALLKSAPELARVVADPSLPPARKNGLVAAVWTKAGASPVVIRLLGLLVEQRRLELLPAIEEAFRHAWNTERGVVEAEVASAVELGASQMSALAKALAGVSGREVEIDKHLDPGLIGGVLVKMAGKSYDGSVRGRLRALRGRLVYGA